MKWLQAEIMKEPKNILKQKVTYQNFTEFREREADSTVPRKNSKATIYKQAFIPHELEKTNP